MNNVEKMTEAAKKAYGENWQSPLSRALGISDRTVRNFVSGKSRVSEDMSSRLLAAMEHEMNKIKSAIAIIESDKINGDEIDMGIITTIVDCYSYSDHLARELALDAVSASVYEITYLSDLHSVAQRYAIK